MKNVIKIVVAGDGGVGRTTLLKRYTEKKFYHDTQMTRGLEFFHKIVKLEGEILDLLFWDFGGQERWRFIFPPFVSGARLGILAFDLTRSLTIENIGGWVKMFRKYNPELPILLIGTKKDLIEDISVEDDYVRESTEKYDFFDYIKISSKTGENVEEVFTLIARKLFGYE